VLELTYTAWDLQAFAQDVGYEGAPFVWDEERRFLLRCELDALYFHLYQINRDDVDYIMETFPIVKRKDIKATSDENGAGGEYITKNIILEMYDQMRHSKSGIHPTAVVSDSAQIGEDCYIGANAVIGDNTVIGKNVNIYPGCLIGDAVQIGDHSILYSGVQIYDSCVVQKSVTLHSGVVIGGDGFGFAPKSEGYSKVAQIGNVIIEDGVEIGANSTVDRATLGHTIIRKGVKLDNLIQIAHNVEIGENTVIAAQTGVAGSTKIGKNCMIGGQVGIVGHLKIGDAVKIAAQSGVQADISDGEIVQGSPAFAVGDYKRSYVYFRKLGQLATDIHKIKKELFQKDK